MEGGLEGSRTRGRDASLEAVRVDEAETEVWLDWNSGDG